MLKLNLKYLLNFTLLWFCLSVSAQNQVDKNHIASKPLYRDPIFDGAADPTIIWNKKEKKWFMFYTNRRAKD